MLPMKELAKMFTAAGCDHVRTYIQSGNVIFVASTALSRRLPGLIGERIAERFGHKPPVLLRDAVQLGEILDGNPFAQADKTVLHVLFLEKEPTPESVQQLDPNRSPGDEFQVRGANVYMWLKNGAAKTKLTNSYFDTKLSTVSTGRNWRTVQMLHGLMCGHVA